jgi:uncharacterized membrane protein YccC
VRSEKCARIDRSGSAACVAAALESELGHLFAALRALIPRRVRPWLSRHRAKVVHALRMAVSSLVAFGVAWGFDLAQGFWAVITALIVTQGSVGSSLKAARDRFLGSVFGAIFGGVVAFAIPHDSLGGRVAALIVAVVPLSLMAAFSAGFRIAPITAIIVLMTPTATALGPFGFAADRVLEIGLGCAVGLLVSVLVVPARASLAVLDTAAQLARLLSEQLTALAADQISHERLNELGLRARKSLDRLEVLVGEAARERRTYLATGDDPEPLFRTLMRVRHDLVMLRRAIGGPHEEPLPAAWTRAVRVAAASLAGISEALPSSRKCPRSSELAEAVGEYWGALDAIRESPGRDLSTDVVGRMFGVAFALDQLRRDLDDLAERTKELAH